MPLPPEFLATAYPHLAPFDAYLYGRASRDPKRRGRSVDDQLSEGRATCDDNGWPILRVFRDDNRSASRHARKKRDDFEEMIEGIEAGEPRIVVAFEASRYYRDLEAYVRLRRACIEAGALLCYNGQVYDLSKGPDRKATARDAVDAEGEAEDIRQRNLRTHRQHAKKGWPNGRVLDGYKRQYDPDTGDLVGQLPDPDRAPVIIGIFRQVAGGKPRYAIIQDLNKEGVTATRGPRWREHHLRHMLQNPAYIGRRIWKGEDVGDAIWPPLSDAATSEEEFVELFYAVQKILAMPSPHGGGGNREPRHLLSFLALCGQCPEEPVLKATTVGGRDCLTCSLRYDTTLRETRMDAYVEEAVLAWLGSKEALAAFQRQADKDKARKARIKLKALEQQLSEAKAAAKEVRADGTMRMSALTLADLEADLTPQIEQARAAAHFAGVPPLLRDFLGKPMPDVEAAWERLEFQQRRTLLRLVVTIRLFKARANGVRTIEPGRVTLSFYGEPGFKPATRDRG